MDLELFEKINFELKDLTKELAYHIVGDPLVLKNLQDYLNISKKHNLKVNIVTTANNINKAMYETLLNSAIKQINFSLNSYNANSHKKSFDEYIDPILDFVSFAKEQKHEFFINFRLWNLDDNKSAKEFNEKVFAKINSFFGLKLSFDEIYKSKEKSIKVDRKIFIHFDSYFSWPNIASKELNSSGFCYGLSSHFGILASGDVVPCCLDKDCNINLGNVKKSSIKEILSSKKAQNIKQGFAKNILVEDLCKKCEYISRFKKEEI